MIPDEMLFANEEAVLLVDTDAQLIDFMRSSLESAEFKVSATSSPQDALEILKKMKFDLVCISLVMPGMTGDQLAARVLDFRDSTELLIMTANPEEQLIDKCLQMGITNYLFKPFHEKQLLCAVLAALHYQRVKKNFLKQRLVKNKKSGLVGVSIATRNIRQQIFKIADSALPVLVMGASGTGKEVIANDIHNNSARNNAVFLPVNCATMGTLAENELFGHVSGAFTGATKSTLGYVGTSHGGTLFLDEVGELPLGVQAKLLRFLDDGQYMRVGEAVVRRADVRIIAATNRDLRSMCQRGEFRTDFYFRLSGEVIEAVPLNERKADIPPLVWHFLEKIGTVHNRTYEIAADAMNALMEFDWPGNVRQLRQALNKICEQAPRRHITLGDVVAVTGGTVPYDLKPYKEAKEEALRKFEMDYFAKLFVVSEGRLKRALNLSGLHKKNFYTKIKQLGLTLKSYARIDSAAS